MIRSILIFRFSTEFFNYTTDERGSVKDSNAWFPVENNLPHQLDKLSSLPDLALELLYSNHSMQLTGLDFQTKGS